MASIEFIEFESLEKVKEYCTKHELILKEKSGFAIIADIVDKKNIFWGCVSKRPKDYKCKNSDTKYVLVWE